MDGLNYMFQSVVDLGCRSGQRLMQILDRYPGTSSIGIDLASPSLKVATTKALEGGFRGRLSFKEGDVCDLDEDIEFAKIDLMTCFMMGHGFWPRENCVARLQRLRKVFPNVRRFILGDATRTLLNQSRSKTTAAKDTVSIFTLGFEFAHAMMGVYTPTVEEWDSVLIEGGWRCVKKHILGHLANTVIFELEREA